MPALLPAAQLGSADLNVARIKKCSCCRSTFPSCKAAASVMILKVEPGSYVIQIGRFRLYTSASYSW